MKPEDLDDTAPVEPDDHMLSTVHARSRTYRRRRTTQRLTSVMAGVVVIALAGGIAWTRIDTSGNRQITLPAATSTTNATTAPALTQDDVIGKWRPVSITGYDRTLEGSLSLDGHGSWTATDGCNDYSGGTYRLDGNEMHLLGPATFTQAACVLLHSTTPANPNFDPIVTAAQIELRDDQFVFLSSDGAEIARFVRAGATARIELAETTITAGSEVTGHVIIENNTGHVIDASGCGSLFQVQLGNDAIHPDAIWTTCAQPLPIPVGESSYPVMFYASYLGCSTPAQGDLKACIPNVGPPPLPPGNYQAQFFQSSPVVTPALPIDVNVVP